MQSQQKPNNLTSRLSSIPFSCSYQFPQLFTQFYTHHIGQAYLLIARHQQDIIAYNLTSKTKDIVKNNTEDYVIQWMMAPFLFGVMKGKNIVGYRWGELGLEEGVQMRVSKMEPRTIARFNKGYYIGGFNRNSIYGAWRTISRSIYFVNQLKPQSEGKIKPQYQIYLSDSDCPISYLKVQTPYLFTYCHPRAYLLAISSRQILITFEKDGYHWLLLEGRFAMSCVNGLGIASKGKLFGFDIQRWPLFGIEVCEHQISVVGACMEKSGRVFVATQKQVYEYNPITHKTRSLVTYPDLQPISSLFCSSTNTLFVTRRCSSILVLDIFSIS